MVRIETGWQCFFYPRHGAFVASLISVGSALGSLLRGQKPRGRAPHHVETFRREMDGLMLYGADAHAGFISKPAMARLEGLKPGRDYRIVALPTLGWRAEISMALAHMRGRPYEEWVQVLKVWRHGNEERGANRIFCSEASVRALAQTGWTWVTALDPDNTSPLDWLLACQKNGGRDVTKPAKLE